jgi:iron complex transport system substrate-binding protein
MRSQLRRAVSALAGIAVAASLVACSSGTDSADSTNTDKNSAYPRTVKTAFSETTIESEPTRVAGLGTVSLESLVALDVDPVYVKVDGKRENQPYVDKYWDSDYVDSSGDEDNSFEKVAASKPDLIIAPSWQRYQDDEVIEKLGTIAPVIIYDDQNSGKDWTDGLSQVAEAVNKKDLADQTIASYNNAVEKQRDFASGLDGKTFITGTLLKDGQFQITTAMAPELINIGLVPAKLQEEMQTKAAAGDKKSKKISGELFNTIGADFIFDFATKTPEAIDLRKDSRAYREHVLDHAYWMYDDEGSYLGTAFNNSGALGKPWMMERINEMFDQHVQL